jgi:hypothetical protein
MTREAAYEQYKYTKRMTLDKATEAGPVGLDPLQPNQKRMFFSRDGYLDFLRSGIFAELVSANDNVTVEMTAGFQFAVTVTEKAADAANAGV